MAAPTAEQRRIAVLEFDVTRNLGVDRIYFSDKVRGAIGLRVPRLFVMTRESTETLLKASGREMSDCQGANAKSKPAGAWAPTTW